MSHALTAPTPTKLSIPEFRQAKGQRKLALLTAYTAPMADILSTHCDMLMVGDSLGMVVYGFDSTLPVTLEMMIAHGAAVVRGARGRCPVVVDLPFGSYQASPEQAFTGAARVLKETGAEAVKLEGGVAMAETIRYLTARAVPVMGHVGLMPQHMHQLGGFKTQGRELASHATVLADAQAVSTAGAFAVVVEGVVEALAEEITARVSIPTIGIGASAACDGQVLVVDDMLGMFERVPRFVKTYADARGMIDTAVAEYVAQVRAGSFPDAAHCYGTVKKGTAAS